MHAHTLQATHGNKHQLSAIFNAYLWRVSSNNIKKMLKFLVQNAQSEQLIVCGITISTGEYHSSQRDIADESTLTDSMVRTALKGLVKFGLIKVKPLPSRKGSIITILNFNYYSEIDFVQPEPEPEQDWSKANPIKANPIKKVVDKVTSYRQLSPADYEIRQIQAGRVDYKAVWTTEAEDHELIASHYGNDKEAPEALRIAKEDLNAWLIRKKKQYTYKNGHFAGLKIGTAPHDKYLQRQAAKKLTESRNNIQAANAAHEATKCNEQPMDPDEAAALVKKFCDEN